jgi:polyketide biosynthesis enoyl-CoA hydratase PksI
MHTAILARTLAEKPRLSLITLKEHLARDIRAKIPEIIEQELKMHDITFHQLEVKQRIESLFGQ